MGSQNSGENNGFRWDNNHISGDARVHLGHVYHNHPPTIAEQRTVRGMTQLQRDQALVKAAAERKHRRLAMLIQADANLDFVDPVRSCSALIEAIIIEDVTTIQLLIDHGADVDIPDLHGNTALHVAASNDFGSIVMLLLKANASVNAANFHGNTPLHTACIIRKRNGSDPSTVTMLLDYGAEINAQNGELLTPLFYAVLNVNMPAIGDLCESPTSRININIQDRWGLTALHYALSESSQLALNVINLQVTLRMLRRHAPRIDVQDKNLQTPLHLACSNSVLKPAALGLLLSASAADVNIKGPFGCTALHVATSMGYTDLVRELIKHDANMDIKADDETTAIDVAFIQKDWKTLKVLIDHKCSLMDSETPTTGLATSDNSTSTSTESSLESLPGPRPSSFITKRHVLRPIT